MGSTSHYLCIQSGQASPKPKYQRDLDREVEKYLAKELKEMSAGDGPDFAHDVDFRVGDAVAKLWRMGMVETVADGADKCIIQAQPLASCVEMLTDGDVRGGVPGDGAKAASEAAAAARPPPA